MMGGGGYLYSSGFDIDSISPKVLAKVGEREAERKVHAVNKAASSLHLQEFDAQHFMVELHPTRPSNYVQVVSNN